MGGQIIVARRVGEGAYEAVGRVVEHLLFTLGAFAFLIILVAYTFHPALFSIAVRSNFVCNSASSFFGYRLFGLPFAFLTYSLNAFLIGITRTKVITLTSFITVSVNIVLDYGSIFGNFGLPAMGIRGAALASVITEICGATFLLAYISRMNVGKCKLFKFSSFSKRLLKSILDISWPLMLQFSLSIFVWFVFFLIIEKVSEIPLAASNIVRSIYIILMIPIWGYASATNSFVSQHIGNGKSDQVVMLVVKVMVITLGSVLALLVLILLLGDSIIKIYPHDEHIIKATLPVIRVIAVAALTMASAFISFNGVSGTGSTKVSFAIEVFTLTIYLGWAYFIAIALGKSLNLVWTSEVLYGILVTVISIICKIQVTNATFVFVNNWFFTNIGLL